MTYGQIMEANYRAFLESLKDDNLDMANILSNRFITDTLFAGDGNLTLIGFILKFQTKKLANIQRLKSQALFNEAKEFVIHELDDMSLDISSFWYHYVRSEDELRRYIVSDQEFAAYDETNVDFTRQQISLLVRFILDNRSRHFPNLIGNAINECRRLRNTHGSSAKDLMVQTFLEVLNLLQPFVYHNSDVVLSEEVVEDFLGHLDFLDTIDRAEDPNTLLPEFNRAISVLGRSWREYYLRYGEVTLTLSLSQRPTASIDPDDKSKLIESIREMRGQVESKIVEIRDRLLSKNQYLSVRDAEEILLGVALENIDEILRSARIPPLSMVREVARFKINRTTVRNYEWLVDQYRQVRTRVQKSDTMRNLVLGEEVKLSSETYREDNIKLQENEGWMSRNDGDVCQETVQFDFSDRSDIYEPLDGRDADWMDRLGKRKVSRRNPLKDLIGILGD